MAWRLLPPMVMHKKGPALCRQRDCVLPHLPPPFPSSDLSFMATHVCHFVYRPSPLPYHPSCPSAISLLSIRWRPNLSFSRVVQVQWFHLNIYLPDPAWATLWKVQLFLRLCPCLITPISRAQLNGFEHMGKSVKVDGDQGQERGWSPFLIT